MRNRTRMLVAAVSLLAALPAHAQGVLLSPKALSFPVRTALLAEVQEARRTAPSAFQALTRLRGRLPSLDEAKRGRSLALTPALKALGAKGLLPMLEALALVAPDGPALTQSAQAAFSVGLLEAVGALRDERARKVLEAVLARAERDFKVDRAAASALGRLSDDAAVAALLQAAAPGPARQAVLAGAGSCRRAAIAKLLAEALEEKPSLEASLQLCQALAEVGNSWAWEKALPPYQSEETRVRDTAARALLTAFLGDSGELRQAASNGLLVVDAPATAALVQTALARATAEQEKALEGLSARLAKNPTRRSR